MIGNIDQFAPESIPPYEVSSDRGDQRRDAEDDQEQCAHQRDATLELASPFIDSRARGVACTIRRLRSIRVPRSLLRAVTLQASSSVGSIAIGFACQSPGWLGVFERVPKLGQHWDRATQ